jgi:hypothetical protein
MCYNDGGMKQTITKITGDHATSGVFVVCCVSFIVTRIIVLSVVMSVHFPLLSVSACDCWWCVLGWCCVA